jgi:hypothetical protein
MCIFYRRENRTTDLQLAIINSIRTHVTTILIVRRRYEVPPEQWRAHHDQMETLDESSQEATQN